MTFKELNTEYLNINSASKYLNDIQRKSRIVDLKEVSDLLVKVQAQISDFNKSRSLFNRVISKLPVVNNLARNTRNEIARQQTITQYVESTLEKFDEKYLELVEHLRVFRETKTSFITDISKLSSWISKAENFTPENTTEELNLKRLLVEAKSELKRKYDTINSLVEPTILAATNLTQNINELTPILKNILYAELKTMAGVNAFRDAANMMISLKESIVEIQKLNIINAGSAISDILENSKTNLLTREDLEEMEKLRNENKILIKNKVKELEKAQKENQEYIELKFDELKNTIKLENKSEFIELEVIK